MPLMSLNELIIRLIIVLCILSVWGSVCFVTFRWLIRRRWWRAYRKGMMDCKAWLPRMEHYKRSILDLNYRWYAPAAVVEKDSDMKLEQYLGKYGQPADIVAEYRSREDACPRPKDGPC